MLGIYKCTHELMLYGAKLNAHFLDNFSYLKTLQIRPRDSTAVSGHTQHVPDQELVPGTAEYGYILLWGSTSVWGWSRDA